MIWTSRCVFVDVDTGEILKNITSEKSLNYINYYVVNKMRNVKIENDYGRIEWTYECRCTGQREFVFK